MTIRTVSSSAPELDLFKAEKISSDLSPPRSDYGPIPNREPKESYSSIKYLANQISVAVSTVNEKLAAHNNEMSVHINLETGDAVIKISDRTSGDVIYQVPSTVSLELAERIEKMIGTLADRVD